MSKDPAFLFYSADFLVGTMGMSDADTGKYIRLLCLQHQKGPMTLEEMEKAVGSIGDEVLGKFERQDDGKYLNARLSIEIEKRRMHSEKQRENIKKRWQKDDTTVIPKPYGGNTTVLPPQGITTVIPLENENANGIENTDRKSKGIKERGAGKTIKGKEKPEDQAWKQWVLEWHNHITTRTGTEPAWQPAEFQALKKIKTYLEKVAKVPDGQTAEEAALQAWRWTLNQWDRLEPWIREQTTLRVIGPKITDIINQLKKTTNGKQTTRNGGIDNEILKRKIAAAFGGGQ